jgi:hypothetical protein
VRDPVTRTHGFPRTSFFSVAGPTPNSRTSRASVRWRGWMVVPWCGSRWSNPATWTAGGASDVAYLPPCSVGGSDLAAFRE